jgi:urease accessory protein UreH
VKNLDITVQAQTAVEITVQAAQKAVDTAQEAAPITAVA